MDMRACSLVFVLFAAIGQVLCQSDVVGKLVVGYQGWFQTPTDGSPRREWVHWVKDWRNPPQPGNCKFELYPDMREYTKTYPSNLARLGNGQPATLFSAWDLSTVNVHFRWMRENGIDTAALQRFGAGLSNPPVAAQLNGVANNVRDAASTNGRKYFIMYDLSGWDNFDTQLVPDINNIIRPQHMSSPAYARQNNKPVICIWGIGFGSRPQKPGPTLSMINQLKPNYYIMCGVPAQWRDDTSAYAPVYRACNMIQPWTVGGYSNFQGILNYKNREQADLQECRSRGIDYQPVVWPGSAWSNWNTGPRNENPRLYGQFMWRQFMNLKELNIPNVYIAMFDEYDEGTAIAKAAENASMIPTNQYFLTLDADNVSVSSDFYLRVCHDGIRLLRGEIVSNPPSPYTPPTPRRLTATNTNREVPQTQQFQDTMANMTPSGLMSMFRDILSVLGL